MRVKQRAIVHTVGIQKRSTKAEDAVEKRAAENPSEYVICNSCGNKVKLTPTGKMRQHRLNRRVAQINCLSIYDFREI